MRATPLVQHTRRGARRQVAVLVISALILLSIFVILRQSGSAAFESGVMLTATHPVRIERTPAIGQFVWQRPDQGANVSFEGEAIDAGELQNQHPSDGGADKAAANAIPERSAGRTLVASIEGSAVARGVDTTARPSLQPAPSPSSPPTPTPSPPPPLPPSNSEEDFPGLKDAINRFFVTTDTDNARRLNESVTRIRELHTSYPPDKPRAAVFILAYMLHCGVSCESPFARRRAHINGCTQRQSIANLVASLNTHMFHSDAIKQDSNYPVVIFHEDWTDQDMEAVESMAHHDSPIFWQKIQLNEGTLPAYVEERELIFTFLRGAHPHGNVSLPNPNLHGYGYRQMCRFYSGLIFHSPVLNEFDFYMR
jgi:hypothetical protein